MPIIPYITATLALMLITYAATLMWAADYYADEIAELRKESYCTSYGHSESFCNSIVTK